MAKPIGPTPILTGEEAIRFITRIQEEAKTKVGLIPTPKLETVCDLIKQHSENGKKHIS